MNTREFQIVRGSTQLNVYVLSCGKADVYGRLNGQQVSMAAVPMATLINGKRIDEWQAQIVKH